MKLIILGSCSGTEPVPGRKHISFVIEKDGGIYWFDAGEGCSYTAYLMGVDLLAVRAIFISHTHMDHIGGLPNLLWNMRKVNGVTDDPSRRLSGKLIRVFIPYLPTWQAVIKMLEGTEGGFRIDYQLAAERCYDGEIFDDGCLRVAALHNTHLGVPEDGTDPAREPSDTAWRSFSFRIESEGKALVYSGDVSSIDELEPILNPCDLLLMETGHHEVERVCKYLRDNRARVGRLMFIHHGREILADRESAARKAKEILGTEPIIAEDGMVLEV